MGFGKVVLGVLCLAGVALTAGPASAAGITGTGRVEILGKCLDVPDWKVDNGTGVEMWDCTGGTNQEWVLGSDGTVRPAFNTGKCLDLPNWQTANGTLLQIWDCNGGSNQQWTLGADHTLRGYGGKCVDNPDWLTANGTLFDYYACNGGTNQAFTLAPSTYPPIFYDTGYITFDGGVPVGGWSKVKILADGSYEFSGSFHDSGAVCFNDGIVLAVKSRSGKVFTFSHSGSMGGTFCGGSRDDNWDQSGSNPDLAAAWADLQPGYTVQWKASVSLDLGDLLTAVEDAVGYISAIIAVVG